MSRSTLVIDACFAITYGTVGRLELLIGLASYHIVIPANALTEVRRPPASTAVRAAITAGKITVESIDVYDPTEQKALARYDSRAAFRGRGEAEMLALAAARGYTVGSDERPVLAVARQNLGAAAPRAVSTSWFGQCANSGSRSPRLKHLLTSWMSGWESGRS